MTLPRRITSGFIAMRMGKTAGCGVSNNVTPAENPGLCLRSSENFLRGDKFFAEYLEPRGSAAGCSSLSIQSGHFLVKTRKVTPEHKKSRSRLESGFRNINPCLYAKRGALCFNAVDNLLYKRFRVGINDKAGACDLAGAFRDKIPHLA